MTFVLNLKALPAEHPCLATSCDLTRCVYCAIESTLLLQIQLPPAASVATPEAAEAAITSAAAEPEQLPPGLLPKPDAALPGLPHLAPAELAPDEHAAPAEHAVASPALATQIPRSISTGLPAAVPSPGAARAGGPGLLPQLKVQIETLEDKELEMRL